MMDILKKPAYNKKVLETLQSPSPRLKTGKDPFKLFSETANQAHTYNKLGYYHYIRNKKYFLSAKNEWDSHHKVPIEWLSKGLISPCIWLALFSKHNTYSFSSGPFYFNRFFFKPGFFIFDQENEFHKHVANLWLNNKENLKRENKWENLKNSDGGILEKRVTRMGWPPHSEFYKDLNIGLVIGYSDYTSAVIVNEDSVENILFEVED